jgi:hypothetical protein
MDDKPHYYMPAGLPPGAGPMNEQEGAPEGVYYYRIYGGILAVLSALVIVAGMTMFLIPLFSSGGPGGSSSAASDPVAMITGAFYTGAGVVFLVPLLLSLFGGRNGWVHTLGTVVLALTMLTLCCVPFSIPVLIIWLRPETKRWYGAP